MPRVDKAQACGEAPNPRLRRFAGRVIRNVNASAPTPPWMRERLERAAALDLGARRRHQLRDARAGPAAARLRPRQAARADRRALGAQRARRCCCSTSRTSSSTSRCCASPTTPAIGLAGIMGGESTKADHHDERVPRVGVLLSRRDRRARAPLRLHERRLAPLRARRGFREQRRRHRARDAADPRDLRRRARARPWTRWRGCRAQARPMRIARAQKVIGVPVPAKDMARRLQAPGSAFAFKAKAPALRRDAAVLPLRHRDRGGPDRGGGAPLRLRAHRRAAAARGGDDAAGSRGTQVAARAARAPCRGRLPRSVINFSFVEPGWEADFAGEANPIRLLNPIASQQSVMRTTLIGSLVANDPVQPGAQGAANPGVRSRAACSCAMPARRTGGPRSVGGLRQPMRIAAAAYGPALPEQWDAPSAAGGLLRREGGPRSAARAARGSRSSRRAHPAFHPGARARAARRRASAGSASCIPSGSRSTSCPSRPCCSRSMPSRCRRAAAPAPRCLPISRLCCATSPGFRQAGTPVQAVIGRHCRPKNRPLCARSAFFSLYTAAPGSRRAKKALLSG